MQLSARISEKGSDTFFDVQSMKTANDLYRGPAFLDDT